VARIGLVDRVVPPDALGDAARELAETACGFSQTAARECKTLLASAGRLDTEEYERAYLDAQQRCLNAQREHAT
jgi:enoyl-CoA hydratase/carnithine racemase